MAVPPDAFDDAEDFERRDVVEDPRAAAAFDECSELWNTAAVAIQRSSLPDQVFRELAEAVLSGRYAAGDRLPPQRALAAELGVNMASLREGIKRLEQLRLVDVRHGDAMRATDWREEGGLDLLVYAVAAEPGAVGSLFEARRLLLREAARLAADRRNDEQAANLRHLADAIATAPDDATAQALDLGFFATVIEASENLVFTLILNSMKALYLERLEPFRAMIDREDDYGAAAQAIENGAADRAAEAVERIAAAQQERMC